AYFGLDAAHHLGSGVQGVSAHDGDASTLTMQSIDDMEVDSGFHTTSSNTPARIEWSSSSDVEVVDVDSDEASVDGDEVVNVKIVHSIQSRIC
ncbi:unnamed protein product, partial [Urochloa humidicola]